MKRKNTIFPHFSKLLLLLEENKEKLKKDTSKWGTNFQNVNLIMDILVNSSHDKDVYDWWNKKEGVGYSMSEVSQFKNLKEPLEENSNKCIHSKIQKCYQKVDMNIAVDNINSTLNDLYYDVRFLDSSLCSDILSIFTKDKNFKSSQYVRQMLNLIDKEQFHMFFAHVLYHIASNFQRMSNSVYLINDSKSKDANIDILYELQSDFEKGLFYDSVVREIIITPNPKDGVSKTTTTTRIETKILSSKNINADYYTFTLGFEYEHFREEHNIESIEVNNKLFTKDEIEIKQFEKEDSKWAFKRNYTVKNIEKSQTYNIKIVQKSIINFPVGEIIYRLPMSASKFKFIAKMSEINKKDKNNFKISGSFLGAFKHKDRVRFLESNNHLFEVEIDRYTPVGAGVKIDIRPHNKLLKYTPPE